MIDTKKEFYIGIEGRNEDSFLIKHIQYNMHARIFSLDYVKYKRIDLLMVLSANKSETYVLLDDKRKASVRIEKQLDIKNVELLESIQIIYEIVFDALKILWDKNRWSINEINVIREEIIRTDYKVNLQFGKKIKVSGDKGYLSIICKFHPAITEYYFDFSFNGVESAWLFFRGNTDPVMLFSYFSLFQWISKERYSISDVDEEISFVLDIAKGTCEVVINPKNNSFYNCQLILKAFEYSNPKHILNVMKL